MIQLREKGTEKAIGSITDAQLQYLIDHLEEEWLEDQDYAISRLVVDSFEAEGADPELVSTLRIALGERDEIDIVWKR